MLKQQFKLFKRFAIMADFAMVLAAFALSYHAQSLAGGMKDFKDYLWVLMIILPVWYISLSYCRLYSSLRMLSLYEITISIAKVHVFGAIITSSIIFLIEPHGVHRDLFVHFLLLSFILLTLEKSIIKLALGYVRRKGYNFRNILVVGTNDIARNFLKIVKQHGDWGLRIVGVLTPDEKPSSPVFEDCNILGGFDSLVAVCRFYAVDEVAFCLDRSKETELDGYIRTMEVMGITSNVVLDVCDAHRSVREISMFDGKLPMLTFHCSAFESSQLFMKRCFDIAGSVFGLLALAVLFPFIAIAIKLDSKGPIFFGQKRAGLNGRIFKCWKFRSMYTDAEKRKKELMHLNEMNGALFKIKDDPRITHVGRFIRKTSLDELPQFWNVFKGEMSLVGTRPPTPDEVAKYENWHRKRICIKPGITGLWQVSGRNKVQDFDEVVKLDLEYIDGWSLGLDIRILFKTVWVVFAKNGSY